MSSFLKIPCPECGRELDCTTLGIYYCDNINCDHDIHYTEEMAGQLASVTTNQLDVAKSLNEIQAKLWRKFMGTKGVDLNRKFSDETKKTAELPFASPTKIHVKFCDGERQQLYQLWDQDGLYVTCLPQNWTDTIHAFVPEQHRHLYLRKLTADELDQITQPF